MGFNFSQGNQITKDLLIKELEKDSGTYLFYGVKGVNIFYYALSFAKALNCDFDKEFCEKCHSCKNIEKLIHPDLFIVDNEEGSIKIEQIREMIFNASNSAYEGGKKVFIIKDVNKMRKESANAILKIIEEPPKNTFFIMLSHSLNIIPTIKSRALKIEFFPLNNEELEVSKEVFDFFDGREEDIKKIKLEDYDFKEKISYKEISSKIKEYREDKNIKIKADIIKGIKDFSSNNKLINQLLKLKLADEISKAIDKDRKLLIEILHLFIINLKNYDKLEEILEIKNMVDKNVNINLLLFNFFMEV